MVKKARYYLFLRDVLILAVTAFGGPQAHMALLFDRMVSRRGYLTEQELIELHALCQMLPGPTSTQTITAIGFQVGGPALAFLTLLVWAIPAVCLMTAAAISISFLQENDISIRFTRFIQPMAVGLVAFAAFRISRKVVTSQLAFILMILAAFVAYFFRSPYIFPIILLCAGTFTAWYRKKERLSDSEPRLRIQWQNFFLWAGVFVGSAVLGHFTRSLDGFLPVRLFENFYRNGSLIFGGGQVLIPFLHTEFVELKHYLTSEEFLSGFAMVQAVPGPVFSFCAYVGTLSMRDSGVLGIILGSLSAAAGVFLPGTFLIFFVIRFWEELKKYPVVKASLEGINAASSGLIIAAVFILTEPLEMNLLNILLMAGMLLTMLFTKIPAPLLIIGGLIAGFIF